MNINSAFEGFYRGKPIHIIRNGKPFDLKKLFRVGFSITACEFINSLGVTTSGTDKTFDNITITTSGPSIGSIKATSTSSIVSSVVLKVTVEDSSGNTVDNNMLICVHNSLVDVYLGQAKIQLHSGFIGENKTFNIIAAFSDDVVVDITDQIYSQGIACISHSPKINFVTSGFTSGFNVKLSGTPAIDDIAGAVEIPIPDYIKHSSSFTVLLGAVKIVIPTPAPPPSPPKYKFINVSPAKKHLDNGPMRILFMGDGFTDTEYGIYEKAMFEVIDRLKKTSPFTIIGDDIDFYSYFMPSLESGGTYIGDFINVDANIYMSKSHYIEICDNIILAGKTSSNIIELKENIGKCNHINLPWSSLPTPTSTAYFDSNILLLSELVNKVGYPVVSDIAKSLSVKNTEWASYINLWSSAKINQFTFDLWKKLQKSTPLKPKDTSLGITLIEEFSAPTLYPSGKTNSSAGTGDNGISGASSIRINMYWTPFFGNLRAFLSTCTDGGTSSIPVGSYFFNSGGGPVTENDCDNGKYVIIISNNQAFNLKGEGKRSTSGLGGNLYVSFFLYDDIANELEITASSSGSSLPVPVMPPVSSNEPKSVGVHEFMHNFFWDEYGEGGGSIDFTTNAGAELNYVDTAPHKYVSNVQPLYDVTNHTGILDDVRGKYIKWNWPRISKIGITSSVITSAVPLSGPYIVTIGKTNGIFAQYEFVILMKEYLEFEYPVLYPMFQIININTVTNEYTLEYRGNVIFSSNESSPPIAASSAFNPSLFGPKSKLVHPKWDPPLPTTLGPTTAPPSYFLGLVQKDVLRLISDYGPFLEIDASQDEMKATNLDIINHSSWPKNPTTRSKIIGLYPGAVNAYDRNIYHATGFCLTRQVLDMNNNNSHNQLCHICKYILSHRLNPLILPDIDNEDAKYYPY